MNSSALENSPLRFDLKYHKKRRNLKLQPGKQPKEILVNWIVVNQSILPPNWLLFVANLKTYILYMCSLKLLQHRNPIQIPTCLVFSMCLTTLQPKTHAPQVALFCVLFWLLPECTVLTDSFPSSSIISYAFYSDNDRVLMFILMRWAGEIPPKALAITHNYF